MGSVYSKNCPSQSSLLDASEHRAGTSGSAAYISRLAWTVQAWQNATSVIHQPRKPLPREGFAHLHVHSEFSMLDGAARVNDMVAAAAADDQPAIAITDHGVLYGVIDFYKAATEAGIKPIIGMEAYVTPGSRFDRPPRREDVRYHMTLLAVSEAGYHNLIQLSSRAYLEGFYYKPRMDAELLAEHSEGIVATTGCLGGHVPQLLAPDGSSEEGNVGQVRDYAGAVAAAARYQDIFC